MAGVSLVNALLTYATFDGPKWAQDESLFDVMYDIETCAWRKWMDVMSWQAPSPTTDFHNIVIQTVDTARLSWLLPQLLNQSHHVLLTGMQMTLWRPDQ
jgi:hypothetical protein